MLQKLVGVAAIKKLAGIAAITAIAYSAIAVAPAKADQPPPHSAAIISDACVHYSGSDGVIMGGFYALVGFKQQGEHYAIWLNQSGNGDWQKEKPTGVSILIPSSPDLCVIIQ